MRQDVTNVLGRAGLVSLSWSQHPAGEGMLEFEAPWTDMENMEKQKALWALIIQRGIVWEARNYC